ncbi:hypothetical protein NP233_g6580 [Leucocoprinus birnbaumii]|uniref:Uncharacterized protein n=1 Tax=Leucocoprinus birnbaumii TaxID=56174 RepID=A0AAD5VRU3_9AGAR|nr:hypothetical protein NP233_g6580 [Leucocoprinus birnbaumii]
MATVAGYNFPINFSSNFNALLAAAAAADPDFYNDVGGTLGNSLDFDPAAFAPYMPFPSVIDNPSLSNPIPSLSDPTSSLSDTTTGAATIPTPPAPSPPVALSPHTNVSSDANSSIDNPDNGNNLKSDQNDYDPGDDDDNNNTNDKSIQNNPCPLITCLEKGKMSKMLPWLKKFQKEFNTLHNSDPEYGGQIGWVHKKIFGKFKKRFGPCGDDIPNKIDRYFRNHLTPSANTNAQGAAQLSTSTASTSSVRWMQVMAREPQKKEMVEALMWDRVASEGITSKGDYLRCYNSALRQVGDSLSEDEAAGYKAQANVETELHKALPTTDDVYLRQELISDQLSDCISDRFGWGAGQAGDAVAMLVVSYQDANQAIKTDISFASNAYIPSKEAGIIATVQAFRENIQISFKELACAYLPYRQRTAPCFSIDYENCVPKDLKKILFKEICVDWKNLPWPDLATDEGRMKLLSRPDDFASLGFSNPINMKSIDWLHEFAQALNAHGTTSLFKPLSASRSDAHLAFISPPTTPPIGSTSFTPEDANATVPTVGDGKPSPLSLPLHAFTTPPGSHSPAITPDSSISTAFPTHVPSVGVSPSIGLVQPPTSAAIFDHSDQTQSGVAHRQISGTYIAPLAQSAYIPPSLFLHPPTSAHVSQGLNISGAYSLTGGGAVAQGPSVLLGAQEGGGDVVRAGLAFASPDDNAPTNNNKELAPAMADNAGRTLHPRNSGGAVDPVPKLASRSAAKPSSKKPISRKANARTKSAGKGNSKAK